MTDHPQTAEAVAYALMCEIAQAEGVAFGAARSGRVGDRRWLLDTYVECLKSVKSEPVKAAPTHGRSAF